MSSKQQTILALLLGFTMIYFGKFYEAGNGNLALQQVAKKEAVLLLR